MGLVFVVSEGYTFGGQLKDLSQCGLKAFESLFRQAVEDLQAEIAKPHGTASLELCKKRLKVQDSVYGPLYPRSAVLYSVIQSPKPHLSKCPKALRVDTSRVYIHGHFNVWREVGVRLQDGDQVC